MSFENFLEIYNEVALLQVEPQTWRKNLKKDEAIDKVLSLAMKTLDYAKTLIVKQSDLIMNTTLELMKERDSTRNSVQKTYSDVLRTGNSSEGSRIVKQTPPLIVKNIPSNNEAKTKLQDALKEIAVNSTRTNKDGDLIVHFPDQDNRNAGRESLMNAFNEEIEIQNPKKYVPKITVFDIPMEIQSNDFKSTISLKDPSLKQMLEDGEMLEIVKYIEIKNDSGNLISYKAILKCSKKIRNHIMCKKNGYLYMNLSRCRVVDKFNVIQCFHCQKFNHVADKCPDKSNPRVCGKCSDRHSSNVRCSSSNVKCVNCMRDGSSVPTDHVSFSQKCPHFLREKNILISKIDFTDEKN